jgi:probable rRNA maturation factor
MIVDITEMDEGWSDIAGLERLCERAAEVAVASSGVALSPDCELSLVLSDDAHVAELNSAWRGREGATNVLSFPAGAEAAPGIDAPPLGDVVLARGTVAREAAEQGKTFENHLCHLIVHGVLHLLGYDHLDDAGAREMEKIEIAALAQLGIANPYVSGDG